MVSALPYLALSMGLVSSFHCIGMCGPIAMALPIQKGSKIQQFTGLLVYNSGRAFTYAVLGLLLGTVGNSLVWIGYLRYLSVFSGVLLLAYVLCPSRLATYLHPPVFWQNFIQQIKKRMAERLKNRSVQSWFFLGILNGLLPCGLVYLALISSIATGGFLAGGIFMLLFGLGTLPAMMAVGFFRQWFTVSWRTKMRRLTPIMMALAGIVLVVRGLLIQYPDSHTNKTNSITVCHGK